MRRVRDLGHDLAQVAFECGQVERELGARLDDDADAPGGREEEQLGHQRGFWGDVAIWRSRIARDQGT